MKTGARRHRLLASQGGQLFLDRQQGVQDGHLENHLAVFLPVSSKDAYARLSPVMGLAYLLLPDLNIPAIAVRSSGEDRGGIRG